MINIQFMYAFLLLITSSNALSDMDIYTKCLSAREDKIRSNFVTEILMEAVFGEEGDTFQFDCGICALPHELPDLNIKWISTKDIGFAKSILTKTTDSIESRIKVTDTKLQIHEAKPRDSGIYQCIAKNKTYAVYKLDVLKSLPKVKHVFESGLKKKNWNDYVKLPKENLYFYTKWTAWTICDRCNVVGKRIRKGICFVKKLNKSVGDYTIIDDFTTAGIPCWAHYTPNYLKKLSEKHKRTNVLQIGYCNISCSFLLPPIKKMHITKANSSTKYISISRIIGESLILSCLNSEKKEKSHIRWKNGSRPMQPEILKEKTKQRIQITNSGDLKFLNLQLIDSGKYKCYVNHQLVCIFTLTVTVDEKYSVFESYQTSYILFFLLLFLCFITQIRRKRKYYVKLFKLT